MEILDGLGQESSKNQKAEHKLLYYFIYSMALGVLLLGGFVAMRFGVVSNHTLLDTNWGFVWLGIMFLMTGVFYWKILSSTLWSILWVALAFFCSFWVTGFLVDTWLHIGRDQPLLAGTVAYFSHWGVTLVIGGLHYIISFWRFRK